MATAKKSVPKKRAAATKSAAAPIATKAVKSPRATARSKKAATTGPAGRETLLVLLFTILSVAFAVVAYLQYGRPQ